MALDVQQRIFHGIEGGGLLGGVRLRLAQGSDVVEHVEPTAEGGDHEIVLAGLDDHVAHGDRRQTPF